MKHTITMEIETDKESVFESVRQFADSLGADLGTSVYFEINVQEPDVPFSRENSTSSTTSE